MMFNTTLLNAKTILALTLLLPSLALAGCSGEEDHNHDDEEHAEDPAEEACLHIQQGPASSTTAAATREETLPSVSAPHTRHDITLVTGDAFGEARGGFVRYEASESGDFTFYLGGAVELEVSQGDTVIAPESMASTVSACEEVKATYTLELQGGSSYTLKLGPTEESAVGLVIEHAGEAHEH